MSVSALTNGQYSKRDYARYTHVHLISSDKLTTDSISHHSADFNSFSPFSISSFPNSLKCLFLSIKAFSSALILLNTMALVSLSDNTTSILWYCAFTF